MNGEITWDERLELRANGAPVLAATVERLLNAMEAEEKRATEAELMLAMMQRRAEAAEREAERLRHGVAIEGDFVCPNALRLDEETEARLASEQFVREADARAVALRRAVIVARQRAQQAEMRAAEAERECGTLHTLVSGAAHVGRMRDDAESALAGLRPLVDAARAVREAHAAVGGDEGIKRAAPKLVEACALVSSIASTHDNPWVREVWTAMCALTAEALKDEGGRDG